MKLTPYKKHKCNQVAFKVTLHKCHKKVKFKQGGWWEGGMVRATIQPPNGVFLVRIPIAIRQ